MLNLGLFHHVNFYPVTLFDKSIHFVFRFIKICNVIIYDLKINIYGKHLFVPVSDFYRKKAMT